MQSDGVYNLTIKQLDRVLSRQGRQQFNYEVFKNAYDSDTRLQNLVKDFNKKSITLAGDETDELDTDDKKKSKHTKKKSDTNAAGK